MNRSELQKQAAERDCTVLERARVLLAWTERELDRARANGRRRSPALEDRIRWLRSLISSEAIQ